MFLGSCAAHENSVSKVYEVYGLHVVASVVCHENLLT